MCIMKEIHCKFTNAEKEACLSIVEKITKIVYTAHCSGVLALCETLETEENEFFKVALGLLIDGTHPDFFYEILFNLIKADNRTGVPLLEKLLIFEGLKMVYIEKGDTPKSQVAKTKIKLFSMLGERYVLSLGEPFICDPQEALNKHLTAFRENAPLEDVALVETLVQTRQNKNH